MRPSFAKGSHGNDVKVFAAANGASCPELGRGAPVRLSNGVVVAVSSGDTEFLGVAIGFSWIDPASHLPVFSNILPAGTSSGGSFDGDSRPQVYIVANKNARYMVQANATMSSGDIGRNFAVTVSSDRPTDYAYGTSRHQLDVASRSTGLRPMKVLSLARLDNNTWADRYPIVNVAIIDQAFTTTLADPPLLGDSSGTAAENAAIGVLVGTITNTGGALASTSIVSGNTGGAFAVSVVSGGMSIQVRTATSLDYETLTGYALVVGGTGAGGTDTANFAVSVTDIAVPSITSATFGINENVPVSTTVGVLTLGGGATTSCTITGGNTSTVFAINDAGVLRVIVSPDYETTTFYTLTIVAANQEGNSTPQNITVSIGDLNDIPIIGNSNATVVENAAISTLVATVTNTGGPIATCSIVSGNTSTVFAVSVVPGGMSIELRTITSLDFETVAVYTLVIGASNSYGGDTATVSVSVGDVAVPTITTVTLGMDENIPVSTTVGVLTLGGGATTSCTIISGNTSSVFAINNSGVLRVIVSPDYETTTFYDLVIVAGNLEGGSVPVTVRVTVSDVNDIPIILNGAATIPENAAIGTIVAIVTNTGGIIASTSIASGNTGGAFAVSLVTGGMSIQILTAASLNFETLDGYTLVIGATNIWGSDTASYEVSVGDIGVPTITTVTFGIDENVAVSTTVGVLTLGGGATTSCTIASGNVSSVFAINDTGVLRVIVSPNYEVNAVYDLVIVAGNDEGGSVPVTVRVTVSDLDDVAPSSSFLEEGTGNWFVLEGAAKDWFAQEPEPIMADGTYTVAENATAGTLVAVVTNTGGQMASVSIVSGNTSTTFAVSLVTGGMSVQVLVNNPPDYETLTGYVLVIGGSNTTGSDSATITVSITDLAAPTVVSATFGVDENVAVSTTVGQVTFGGGAVTTCTILSGNTSSTFAINDAGLLRVIASPDYEATSFFTLTIRAGNAEGTNTGTVTVSVSNVAEGVSATFSTETGDNIVLNIAAWASATALGSSFTLGSITGWFRTNASKLYYASAGGTTGNTAPTHSTGTATDGTIIWEFCCTVGYTTLAGWIADIPVSLAAPETGIVWADAEISATGTAATIPTATTDSTNYITLKSKEELAWYNHATPVGAYNAAKGIAITAPDGYARGISIGAAAYTRVKGLQVRAKDEAIVFSGGNAIFDRGVLESTSHQAAVFSTGDNLVRNSYLIVNSTYAAAPGVYNFNGSTNKLAGCVVARPSNITPAGKGVDTSGYGSISLINCAVMGFISATTGSITATYTACDDADAVPAGTGNITAAFDTTQFIQPSAASALNLRIPTGSALKNAGTTDTTNIPDSKDAFGTTRSTWDMGAHEFV